MKNTLVQWQGGGYEGCFWEPNTGYYDAKGLWHPIISTGRGARPESAIDEDDLVFPITKDGLKEFCENIRDDFFIKTLKVLEDEGYTVYWECDCCEHTYSDMDDFHSFENYQGDGGIGIVHDGKICYDCHIQGQCHSCGEFYGENQLDYGICEHCMEEACKDVKDEIDEIEKDIEKVKEQAIEYAKVVPKYRIKGYRDAIKIRKQLSNKINNIKQKASENYFC